MKISKQHMLKHKYPTRPLRDKICLLTGFTSGIGRVTARHLAAMGATLVLPVRNAMRGEAIKMEIKSETENDRLYVLQADLSVQKDIRTLAAEFKRRFDRLDILINNAGAVYTERRVTVDNIERTLALNHLAYFLLTNLLLDSLKKSPAARVINVASAAHRNVKEGLNFDDLQNENDYKGFRVYSQTKLANILFTYELAQRLNGHNITANCLHPGSVATAITRDYPAMVGILWRLFTPRAEKGAETVLHLAAAPELEGISGRYFARKQPRESSANSLNAEAGRRLWAYSERMCGLQPGQANSPKA